MGGVVAPSPILVFCRARSGPIYLAFLCRVFVPVDAITCLEDDDVFCSISFERFTVTAIYLY